MKLLTVVIPTRSSQPKYTTIQSLAKQSILSFNIIFQPDYGNGAQWARNEGFRYVRTEYVLFSDDDIQWYPDALENMLVTLFKHPEVAYSYGAYKMDNRIQCNVEFDPEKLKRHNYISTMTIIQSRLFPGFDDSLKRLQDWDVWLTLLERGHVGKYCGSTIFETTKGEGITYGKNISYEEAARIVKGKHRL